MARNFGVPRQIDRHERAPVWPTWLVTFAIKLGIINPGKLPYSGYSPGAAHETTANETCSLRCGI
jgi:hypothetical protein